LHANLALEPSTSSSTFGRNGSISRGGYLGFVSQIIQQAQQRGIDATPTSSATANSSRTPR
jgi:hypothetical protein